jgi:hypothetical protein
LEISEKKACDLFSESCGKDEVINQPESKLLEVLELKDRLQLDLEATSKEFTKRDPTNERIFPPFIKLIFFA